MVISKNGKRKRKVTTLPATSAPTAASHGAYNAAASATAAAAAAPVATTSSTPTAVSAAPTAIPPSSGSSSMASPSSAAVAAMINGVHAPLVPPSQSEAVTPMTPEAPKRIKVHAQRKFAQGQGCSSSNYGPSGGRVGVDSSNLATNTGASHTEPIDLLPNNIRPYTEDFIKFLCFRGTSVLPSHLDYFNSSNAAAAAAATAATAAAAAAAVSTAAAATAATASNTTQPADVSSNKDTVAASTSHVTSAIMTDSSNTPTVSPANVLTGPVSPTSPPFIPFAVRKQAESVSDGGKRRQAVQALKKKYQEQRMAKTQVQNLTKAKARTRGNSVSGTAVLEQSPTQEGDASTAPEQRNGSGSCSKTPTAEILSKTICSAQPEMTINSFAATASSSTTTTKSTPTKDYPPPAASVADSLDHESVKTSDTKSTRRKAAAVARLEVNHLPTRLTRQHALAYPESYRKAEEAALNSIKQTQACQAAKLAKQQKPPTKCSGEASDGGGGFSSDDDRPLVKVLPNVTKGKEKGNTDQPLATAKSATKKRASAAHNKRSSSPAGSTTPVKNATAATTPSAASAKKPRAKRRTTSVEPSNELKIIIKTTAESVDSTSLASIDTPATKKICSSSLGPELPATSVHTGMHDEVGGGADSLGSDETPTSKKKLMASIESVMKSFVEDSQWEEETGDLLPMTTAALTSPAAIGAVLCPPAKSATQLPTVALLPNETDGKVGQKARRPSRKTKEAAAIYMELIGQRLNLGDDSDEDNASMDSLPELPNLRKTEQMEIELKANIGKEIAGLSRPSPIKKRGSLVSTKTNNDCANDDKGRPGKVPSNNTTPSSKRKIERKKTQKTQDVTIEKTVDKLEKSFSDSDEEPLAIKLSKVEGPAMSTDATAGDKSTITINAVFQQPQTPHRQRVDDSAYTRNIFQQSMSNFHPSTSSLTDMPHRPTVNYSPAPSKPSPPALSMDSAAADVFDSPHGYPRTPSYQPSPFKAPSHQQQPSTPTTPLSTSPVVSSRKDSQLFKSPSATPTSTKQQPPLQTPNTASHQQQLAQSDANSTESVSAILANLMPSKEESGKIFGIASVTLAQSSGPNDTKCTLGKCGSVHKPPLGPVVTTETSTVLSDAMSSKERRKAKVNMTHEQIQKWLNECAVNQEMLDDLREVDLTVPPVPINYLETASPVRDLIQNSTSTPPEPLTASQSLQSTSSTPTTAKPKATNKSGGSKNSPNRAAAKDSVQRNEVSSTSTAKTAATVAADKSASLSKMIADERQSPATVKSPIEPVGECMDTEPPVATHKESSPAPVHKTNSVANIPNTKINTISATVVTATPTTPTAPPAANKTSAVHNNAKRTPVYNSPITGDQHQQGSQRKPIVNSFGAFSPENESSIYSFDKDDDFSPTNAKTSFKRSKDPTSAASGSQAKKETAEKPAGKSKAGSKTPQTQEMVSLTLNPEEHSKSSSIAVQVSMDLTATPKSTKTTTTIASTSAATPTAPVVEATNHTLALTSTTTTVVDPVAAAAAAAANGTDATGHTFYIPLQGTHITGGKSDQIIQGVAVKLGTEGPDGPNQRLIMHAKLVTKTIPESLSNGSSKTVPVGTVQPRFKSSDESAGTAAASATAVPVDVQFATADRPQKPAYISRRPANEPQIHPCNTTTFPRSDANLPAQMVEAPTFRPTEREFADPMEFFDRIYPLAARFGLCRVIPPASFRPECKISDDMRFTAYNQYVHKMLNRWGPSAKEFSAIRKYLATQRVKLTNPPWIGGMEVDLPRLYHTVQELGGLKEVIEKKKWGRVAEEMCFPKTAQDRVSKLDDIYCKYLLPYDTLSPAERQKLFEEVEADWAKREAKARRSMQSNSEEDDDEDEDEADEPDAGPAGGAKARNQSDDDDEDDDDEDEDDDEEEDDGAMECIVEGRKMPLKQFFRIARNTMALWFKNTEPTSAEIEAEFWRHVAVRDSHVCVHSGSIDSSGWGYGFPTPGPKGKVGSAAAAAAAGTSATTAACAKHPWNLKVLTNNHGSILRSIGPVTGVTVPTLHVGMLFSACCWYRDPHGLPWIEYLHTGGSKIWYGVPEEQSANFRAAFTSLVPTHCQNKTVWLPCDTAMVPPHMLTDRGVSLCRVEQEPGQFVIVFPRAYTSSLTTGYAISESVYFATSMWLDTAKEDFKDIHDSCEPAMFSLEQLLFAVASDTRTSSQTLDSVYPMMREVFEREKSERDLIKSAGVTRNQKVPIKGSSKKSTSAQNSGGALKSLPATGADEAECDTCRANLYISWIHCDDDAIYCLQHGLKQINDGRQKAAACRMLYAYSMSEVEQLMERIRCRTASAEASSAAAGDSAPSTSTGPATSTGKSRKSSGKGR